MYINKTGSTYKSFRSCYKVAVFFSSRWQVHRKGCRWIWLRQRHHLGHMAQPLVLPEGDHHEAHSPQPHRNRGTACWCQTVWWTWRIKSRHVLVCFCSLCWAQQSWTHFDQINSPNGKFLLVWCFSVWDSHIMVIWSKLKPKLTISFPLSSFKCCFKH